jgi:diaminopimelate decarboxylase
MKPRLYSDADLADWARRFGTPLYVYDGAAILQRLAELRAFDRVRYAQKANSNLALLRLLREAGAHVDAVSAGEIERALRAGWAPEDIVYTADVFDADALALVVARGTAVNAGSADMIEQLARAGGPRALTLRVNPGFGHGHDDKVNTGGEASKHGIWHAELPDALARARRAGLRVTGLHMHIGSGSDFEHLARVCDSMRAAAVQVGAELRSISAGGGLPTPYRPSDRRINVARYAEMWLATRDAIARELGQTLSVEVEPGRYLVAEAGLLLARVCARKQSGSYDYVLVDAGFHNLVRPAMYGAYHQISVLGRDAEPHAPRIVAGPLCESSDVFTQRKGGGLDPQPLPDARVGDLVCIHDCGAYAASMASNYNSQLLAAEVLVEGGSARIVRRRQDYDHLFALEVGFEANSG